jgi:hypothetical protein
MVEGGAERGKIFVKVVTGWLPPSLSPLPLASMSLARGRCAHHCIVIRHPCCRRQRRQRRQAVRWQVYDGEQRQPVSSSANERFKSGTHLPPPPPPDCCPPSTATVHQSCCCCRPINCHHPPPSWLLLHCPPPFTCAKTMPLCHRHSNLFLTLPTFIALSTTAGQCCKCNPGSSPPLQPLPPLRSHCHRCRNLLHTLCLLCLLSSLPATSAATARCHRHHPVDHRRLPPPPNRRFHCHRTAVATDNGLPPCQPPPSALMLLLLLLPPCNRPPPPTARHRHLCHLTPAFVDCCIFNCPIFSLA